MFESAHYSLKNDNIIEKFHNVPIAEDIFTFKPLVVLGLKVGIKGIITQIEKLTNIKAYNTELY